MAHLWDKRSRTLAFTPLKKAAPLGAEKISSTGTVRDGGEPIISESGIPRPNLNRIIGLHVASQPMTNVYSQVSYERPKGPKVLSRVPLQSSTLSFEIQRALLKNFDYLVAVDTNTRIINTRNVSVTAVVTFKEASPLRALELTGSWMCLLLGVHRPQD